MPPRLEAAETCGTVEAVERRARMHRARAPGRSARLVQDPVHMGWSRDRHCPCGRRVARWLKEIWGVCVCVVGVQVGAPAARARTSSASWGAQHQATCRMVLAMCTFVRRECVRRGKNQAWGGGAPRGLWCTTPCASRRTAPAHAGGTRLGSLRQSKGHLAARLGARRRAALRRKWNTSIR